MIALERLCKFEYQIDLSYQLGKVRIVFPASLCRQGLQTQTSNYNPAKLSRVEWKFNHGKGFKYGEMRTAKYAKKCGCKRKCEKSNL